MLREDQVALLEGCPAHWRFALTGQSEDVKRCFETDWNERGNGRTLDNVLRLNSSPSTTENWISRKMIGVGVITGEESNGLLVVDFDGHGSQAVRAFVKHFHQYPSKLPRTVANLSGKRGRAKLYFSVPPHWWTELEGRSASWRLPDGNVVLEAIWENSTLRGRHAVIVGDHPHSSHQNPLWYRWAEGCAPSECPVAEAPEWLLLGILAQMHATQGDRSLQERQRRGEDDATPWERLTSFERRELVELALPFCPNRRAKGSGTYEKARRVMTAVLNEFGLETATMILEGSDWDKANEWEGTDCAKTLASLASSKVAEESKSRIASVFFFAREAGWMPPSWAVPPVEMKQHVEGLKKLLNEFIKAQGDPPALAAISGRARREYGVDSAVMRRLSLEQYLGDVENYGAQTLDAIAKSSRSDNIHADVIDGFLGRRVYLVAGASHSGKTTLACFLANRVMTGVPLDVDNTRHGTHKGRVLIFTSDCSNQDMLRDLALEGVTAEAAADNVRVCAGRTFDDMLFICRQLEEFAPDLVIYDCLSSMACRDVGVGDPSYADPIRLLVRHNGLAWPKCAHVVLHHTTRDEPMRFSGTEQIKAATEELWVYYAPELAGWRKGQPQPKVGPTRHLRMDKSRSGYQGRTLCVTRNAFQGTWQFHRQDMGTGSALELLSDKFRAVTHDEWRIASEWQKELDLAFNPRSLRRYLDQLVGTVLETEKRRSDITGRVDTHYRPREVLRDGAKAMVSSRGDGINTI